MLYFKSEQTTACSLFLYTCKLRMASAFLNHCKNINKECGTEYVASKAQNIYYLYLDKKVCHLLLYFIMEFWVSH